jgi:uncharacterized protein (DUF305 family)
MRRISAPIVLSACFLSGIAACNKGETPSTSDSAAVTAAATTDSGGHDMAGMGGMANMTGDPDHDFLRAMSDHHIGMIAMVHPTIEATQNLSSKPDAKKLDQKQDDELDRMKAMLQQQFNDSYEPKVMPDDQKMVDDLKTLKGKAYDKRFYEHVVMHHQQAIKVIDEYLPKGKMADVKSMAEKMKADQTKEIAEFQKKIASL